MKIIIAQDKFKGSLTTFEVCRSIEEGIRQVDRDAEIRSFPMADGGDGFANVLKYYSKTQTVACSTVDPLGRNIAGTYEWNPETRTAIVELAVASGLVLLEDEEKNPLATSTFGTGLLIKDALKKGAKKIVLGLGGSATNDAGTGILQALGFTFLDGDGKKLEASGGNLRLIETIISPEIIPAVHFIIACDVQNVLFGESGAAYVYATQKGATPGDVLLLDAGLKHFSQIVIRQTKRNIVHLKGTGAAGGIAAGLMAYFGVELRPGTELVMSASNIADELPVADVLFTGEGKIDEQTGQGKVVSAISKIANKHGVPVVALCGLLKLDEAGIQQCGITVAAAICEKPYTLHQCMDNAYSLLKTKAAEIFYQFYKKG